MSHKQDFHSFSHNCREPLTSISRLSISTVKPLLEDKLPEINRQGGNHGPLLPRVVSFAAPHGHPRLFSVISVLSWQFFFGRKRHRELRGHGEEAKKTDLSGADHQEHAVQLTEEKIRRFVAHLIAFGFKR
jgi:hypothetical protein